MSTFKCLNLKRISTPQIHSLQSSNFVFQKILLANTHTVSTSRDVTIGVIAANKVGSFQMPEAVKHLHLNEKVSNVECSLNNKCSIDSKKNSPQINYDTTDHKLDVAFTGNDSMSKTVQKQDSVKAVDDIDKLSKVSIPVVPNKNNLVENDSSDQGSKVVVQVMENNNYGHISALEQCIIHKLDVEKRSSISKKLELARKRIYDPAAVNSVGSIEWELDDQEACRQTQSSSKYSSNSRMRGKHRLNLHIRQGQGFRFLDIDRIVRSVKGSTPNHLRVLHYILFGQYGVIKDGCLHPQMMENLLHFSGFSFLKDSEALQKKRRCLLKIPFPMLSALSKIILGYDTGSREENVHDILKFLMNPTMDKRTNEDFMITLADDKQLMEKILRGPQPIVLLHKLSEEELVKMYPDTSPELFKSETIVKGCDKPAFTEYTKPGFIKIGHGTPLKLFPKVVEKMKTARRRTINLLHQLLYGRPGSNHVNRLNILEFSGFSFPLEHCKRKKEFLSRLKNKELVHMCDIFSLRVKSGIKPRKVQKLLEYLQAPSLKLTIKRKTKSSRSLSESEAETEVLPRGKRSESVKKIEMVEQPVLKLKDFEKIRSNVECAPPNELIELNDLLFPTSCDDFDIHERILGFTALPKDETSLDFQHRKTLIHYMDFDILRKMARLLDITDWDEYIYHKDLAATILKFLMEMKPTVKIRRKVKASMCDESWREEAKKLCSMPPHKLVDLMEGKDLCTYAAENCEDNVESFSSGKHNSAYVSRNCHKYLDCEGTAVSVRKISDFSYAFTDLNHNELHTISNNISDESLPLSDFIDHPSEKDLKMTIRSIISDQSLAITMGDLINRVFNCYPKLNLMYRTDFIKAQAVKVIQEFGNKASETAES